MTDIWFIWSIILTRHCSYAGLVAGGKALIEDKKWGRGVPSEMSDVEVILCVRIRTGLEGSAGALGPLLRRRLRSERRGSRPATEPPTAFCHTFAAHDSRVDWLIRVIKTLLRL